MFVAFRLLFAEIFAYASAKHSAPSSFPPPSPALPMSVPSNAEIMGADAARLYDAKSPPDTAQQQTEQSRAASGAVAHRPLHATGVRACLQTSFRLLPVIRS